jgi:beta-glucanase (GH16 family)
MLRHKGEPMSVVKRLMLALTIASGPLVSMVHAESLPNWKGVQLKAFNYKNLFFPSEWGEGKLGGYNWRSANAQITNGTLNLSVSERASGQVQANDFRSKALWEVDVTLPKMASGLVAAPLWVMGPDVNGDEIDFEFVGVKGLTITAWTNVNGKKKAFWSRGSNAPLIPGDLSGKSYRLGIAYEAGKSITWYVDGKQVAKITPQDTGGVFPSLPMKPFFDIWVANGADPGWAGKWTPMAPGTRLTMQVTGYKVTSIK